MADIENSLGLRQRLRRVLTESMKARDLVAVSAVRSCLSAIDNAEAVDVSLAPGAQAGAIAGAVVGVGAGDVDRRDLTEQDISGIVRAEITERESAAAQYEAIGQKDRAERLLAEAAVLRTHIA